MCFVYNVTNCHRTSYLRAAPQLVVWAAHTNVASLRRRPAAWFSAVQAGRSRFTVVVCVPAVVLATICVVRAWLLGRCKQCFLFKCVCPEVTAVPVTSLTHESPLLPPFVLCTLISFTSQPNTHMHRAGGRPRAVTRTQLFPVTLPVDVNTCLHGLVAVNIRHQTRCRLCGSGVVVYGSTHQNKQTIHHNANSSTNYDKVQQ